MANNKSASNREGIDTGREKSYVHRDDKGQFKENDDVGGRYRRTCGKEPGRRCHPDSGDQKDRS